MKWYYQGIIIIYGLVALYFIYMSALTMFVYFSNKMNGHHESFLEPGKNLVIALFFSLIALGSWFLIGSTNYSKLGYMIFYIPLVLIGLFVIWTLSMLIGSGGKWN